MTLRQTVPTMKRATALLDCAQMQNADAITVAAGTTVGEMMANAGRAVADEIEKRWSARPVLVVCGPGNNGGDGMVAALRLVERGWPVRVALFGTRDSLSGDLRRYAQQWARPLEQVDDFDLTEVALLVDAVFGAGLDRPFTGAAADLLAAAAIRELPIVAIDVPSGVKGDSGESLGAVGACLTVTFFRKKPGHLLMPGKVLCGEVVVAGIGTVESALDEIEPDCFENDPALWLGALPEPMSIDNKYDRGHVMVYGGYPMTGAARLAARAAARVGAGLTTIVTPAVALTIYATTSTSVMVRPFETLDEFDSVLADHRISAMLIGPGAGLGDETRSRTLRMLSSGRPVVLDADAITSFASDPQSLVDAIHGPCVMTPHDGEFARMFDAHGDKLTRTRKAAQCSGAVIVLKGSDTVIASPDGRTIVNSNAPATLSTAGSGDVLSGLIAGLLAQGMDPFLAAAAAVWMHGAAAMAFGPGLLSEDLPEVLPIVLRELIALRGTSDQRVRSPSYVPQRTDDLPLSRAA